MTNKPSATEVFYDGACPLCRAEIETYRRGAGMDAITWRDVSETAPEGLDRARLLARFHARLETGEIVSGAAAFLAIWRRHPRLRWLGVALDRWPFRPLLELGYRGFLKLRPLWRKPAGG